MELAILKNKINPGRGILVTMLHKFQVIFPCTKLLHSKCEMTFCVFPSACNQTTTQKVKCVRKFSRFGAPSFVRNFLFEIGAEADFVLYLCGPEEEMERVCVFLPINLVAQNVNQV